MPIESLSAELSARPNNDLLRLYVQYMTRKKSNFDGVEIATDANWACASMMRTYASGLDRHWEGFVRKLRENGVEPNLTWSLEAENEDRPGESDKRGLHAEMEKLAVQLETSHIITNG